MRKYLIYILPLLLSAGMVEAQNKVILDGVSHIIPQKGQTVYIQRISLKNNIIPKIKLIDIKTKPVFSNKKNDITAGHSFTPDILIATARKQKYATIRIPLYKKAHHQIQQLTAYNLSVVYPEDRQQRPTGTARRPTQVQHSVLANGIWYKISVPKRGLYKIDYDFLQSMGLQPGQINPKDIRIYGNGGTVLPETVSNNQPDDLIENAVYVHANGNRFQQGDYVLFYANGPTLWSKDSINSRFTHTNNPYSDKSYYFLTFDKGQGMSVQNANATGAAVQTYTTFNNYAVYDQDKINIQAIGRTWWSNQMNSQTGMPSTTNLTMNIGAITDSVFAKVHVANVNDASGNTLTMKINNKTVKTFSLGASTYSTYFVTKTAHFKFKPNTPNLAISFNYNPAGNGSAYIDYIELNYQSPLQFSGQELTFRNWASAALPSGQKAKYKISHAPVGLKVWDITNPLKPVHLEGDFSGNTYSFTQNGGQLHQFIAFKGQDFPNPGFVGQVPHQDLHGLPETDLLIITNDSLKPAAEAFANFHREKRGIKVTIATVDKIYNEFSSGGQDISGIRNFIKMFYDRAQNQGEMIKNVLLLGAASYDYKNRIPNNTNFVPTYETVISNNESNAFSTDDYFAVLDPGENVLSTNNMLDVGMGRIPATTVQQALDALDKIKHYVSPKSFGPWKNVVTFVADDHDPGASGMNHLNDCETISSYFWDSSRLFNLYKIYSDAYNKVAEAGGSRYPDVNRAINDRIFNGTFLMSYSGHGNATRWSHEAILTPKDYDNWKNIDHLPIMFTGTCDFGRFDDPEVKYAGVKLMMNPDGGCIAIVTTTQAVYQSGNTQLGSSFMQKQFTQETNGHYYSFGEALRKAKNDIHNGFSFNKVKYVLLGDPAIHLPIPKLKVHTDSLLMKQNGQFVLNDTLKALGNYSLKGRITDINGNLQSNFNGSVYISIFDKPTTVRTVNPAPGVTPTFRIENNTIAKARAKVKNGHFTANFIVPKDINYDIGKGKISYYAASDTRDANGFDTTKDVGGFNRNAQTDDVPPIVKAYIDNDKFRNGGITGPNPLLFVKLSDDHGINVSGSSVGHNLIAILDGDIQHPIILNDYYQTLEGDFRKGHVNFPMHNLPEGKHTVTVRAWDTYNNSGKGSVTFIVKNKDKGFINDLYNYPNPVKDVTHFVFQHNQANVPMTITLQIFDATGALKWSWHKKMTPEGNQTEITWDGKRKDGQPMAKGVYFYRLHIQTEKGKKATAYNKLVLLRP